MNQGASPMRTGVCQAKTPGWREANCPSGPACRRLLAGREEAGLNPIPWAMLHGPVSQVGSRHTAHVPMDWLNCWKVAWTPRTPPLSFALCVVCFMTEEGCVVSKYFSWSRSGARWPKQQHARAPGRVVSGGCNMCLWHLSQEKSQTASSASFRSACQPHPAHSQTAGAAEGPQP